MGLIIDATLGDANASIGNNSRRTRKRSSLVSFPTSSIIGVMLLLVHTASIPTQVDAFAPSIGSTRTGHRGPSFRKQDPNAQHKTTTTMMMAPADMASFYSSCLESHYYQTQMMTGAVFCTFGDLLAQVYLTPTANGSNEDAGASLIDRIDTKRATNYFLKGLGGGIMWACWFQIADGWSLELTNEIFDSLSPSSATSDLMFMDATSSDLAASFDGASLFMDDTDNINTNTNELGLVAATESSASPFFQPVRVGVSILLEQFIVCPLFYTFWDIPVPALLSGSPPRQIPNQIQSKLGPLLIANAKVWTVVNMVTYNLPLQYRVLFTSFADILWQCINASITSQSIVVEPTAAKAVEEESSVGVPVLSSSSKRRLGKTRPSMSTLSATRTMPATTTMSSSKTQPTTTFLSSTAPVTNNIKR